MIDTYDKLTIEKFYEIEKVMKEDLEDIDIQVKLISILTDKDEEEILNTKLDKYEEYVSGLNFLLNKPIGKDRYINSIKLNGVKYNLLKTPEKMTAGQFIDFQSYIENNLGIEYTISTFLIPEGKKYGEYDVVPIIEDIRKYMDIQTAYNIRFFFRKKFLNTIKSFLIYLDWMTKNRKLPKEQQEKMKMVRNQIKQLLSSLNGNGNI